MKFIGIYGLEDIGQSGGGSSSPAVNPDWNENDPSSAGYIKNRTHYIELTEKFNRTTTAGRWNSDGSTDSPAGWMEFLKETLPSEGTEDPSFPEYRVVLDGVTYNNVEVNYSPGHYNIWRIGDNSENLPFVVEWSNYGYSMFYTPSEHSGGPDGGVDSGEVFTESHSLAIYVIEDILTLDPLLLPAATYNSYGAVKVDGALSDSSTNPVQNRLIKAALDELRGSIVTVDTELSDSSTNPVQNKIVTEEINSLWGYLFDELKLGESLEELRGSIESLTQRVSALEGS